jgi:putative nucleotidyltransferase with HDIG domain
MISRNEVLIVLQKYIKTENTVKHMLAAEVIMRALAKRNGEPEKEEEYALAGLLHDIDYETINQTTKAGHGKESVKILKKEGADLPQSVFDTILAHCYNLYPEFEPKNKMEWSLFICDSLTGLIVAVTLVRPEKKLSAVTLEHIQKKWKEKSFAAGTRREDIALCQEKLGISLSDFIALGLKAMQGISKELGL